jgi:PAS domain S-box-containing protein
MADSSAEYNTSQVLESSSLYSKFRMVIWISLSIVFIISIFDLTGWILHISFLERLKPPWEPMKPGTALCFAISALTLVILEVNLPAFIRKTLSFSFAFFVCGVSLISLYVYLCSVNTALNTPLIHLSSLSFILSPIWEMSFLTACNFLFIGCLLFLLTSNNIKASNISHIVTIPVFLISYFIIVSYILGVYSINEFSRVSGSLGTGVAFCGLVAAVLFMRPDTWLIKLLYSRDTAGIISRKLLPPLIILPIIIGWLRIYGERTRMYRSEEGVILVAVAYTTCFLILIWLTARSIERIDRKRHAIEDALRESEERFRTIAESLPVLISIFSIKDSIVSFVNESYENAFGYKKGEITNSKLPDSFFNAKERINLNNVLKVKGRVYNKEIKVKKTDGKPFWIMTSIRRILFMNEPAYLTASIDITETKRAQEELLRLNRILDAHSKSSQAMMHSKDEFKYLHEVCKIIIEDCGHSMVWVGYAQNDKSKSVKPVAYYGFDKGYINQLNITWSDTERGRGPTGTAIRTGKPSICKDMLTDPAFKPWKEAAIQRGYSSSLVLPLILEGKPFGSISIYSKESDSFSDSEINMLSDLADDLAYGISYLRLEDSERSAVNVIKENDAKLKELIATKDKFFNIIAHDLKNPFTSILGSSELLFENIHNLNPKNIKELSMILNDSAKAGYAILQNLLDWSRSQTGLLKINSEKVNLKVLINENISTLQLPAANKEIKISNKVNEDIFVFSDKNMLNTILRNILSNSLKFTYKSGKVLVSTAFSSDEVTVSVKDNGIGIPADKIESLFRIDVKNSMPGTENEQGTGLGLKLSKEFVEKLGGRIWVESIAGEGSEFKFTIPLKT